MIDDMREAINAALEQIQAWKETGFDECVEEASEVLEAAITKKIRCQEPVAFTGSGSLTAVIAGEEGYIWGAPAKAHPVALYLGPQPTTKVPDGWKIEQIAGGVIRLTEPLGGERLYDGYKDIMAFRFLKAILASIPESD